MGIAVYTENQIHERVYAGSDVGLQLARLLEQATDHGLLADIGPLGDTMFNIGQLYRLDEELREIGRAWPELAADAEAFCSLIQTIIRNRGYLWLSGD